MNGDRGSLQPVEPRHDLDVGRVGEEIDQGRATVREPQAREHADVAAEGRGIAAHEDQPGGTGRGEPSRALPPQTRVGPGRRRPPGRARGSTCAISARSTAHRVPRLSRASRTAGPLRSTATTLRSLAEQAGEETDAAVRVDERAQLVVVDERPRAPPSTSAAAPSVRAWKNDVAEIVNRRPCTTSWNRAVRPRFTSFCPTSTTSSGTSTPRALGRREHEPLARADATTQRQPPARRRSARRG